MRSRRTPTTLCTFALQIAVLYVPGLQRAFNTVPLDGRDWALATIVASSVL